MSNQIKVLAIGFYQPGTGFSRVMQHIIEGIKDKYEIHYFGVSYYGPILQSKNVTIYPEGAEQFDPNGLHSLHQLGEEIQPDIIFMVHDLRYQKAYISALKNHLEKSRFVCYTPLDGKVINKASIAALQDIDHCVFYTEFASQEIQRALDKSIFSENSTFEVVPHGVDTQTFYPLEQEERKQIKKELFSQLSKPEEAFIVFNGNRADPRKRLDITLDGFARFAQGKPENVKLYLHHPFLTGAKRHALDQLIDQYQIRHRLILNQDDSGHCRPVSDQRLNEIYNACDVGINTAMGEGWGLVSLEQAACRVPQIVPNHSALTEIWEGAADFLEPVYEKQPWFSDFSMAAVSAEELAQKLERLYVDKDYRCRMADAAYNRATEDRLNWSVISEQWGEVFEQLSPTFSNSDREGLVASC